MTTSLQKIEEVFNIEETKVEIIETVPSEIVELLEKKISHKLEDSTNIKSNLKDTLIKAQSALDSILDELTINPSSRNAEGVAKIIDSISKLSQTLIDINVKEKEHEIKLNSDKKEDYSQSTITNNTLIMSTEEILTKILEKKQEQLSSTN